jgi:serine/threonine protein phosphatase PrpC
MPAIWTALSASVRGAQHEREGRKNQDAVRLRAPASGADALVIALADGHGSAQSFRSDRGSALATECALRQLRSFVRRNGPEVPLSRIRRQLESKWPQAMLEEWHRLVREEVEAHPFSQLDFAPFPVAMPVARGGELPFHGYLAYGATLVVALVTRRYIAYAQLGDGDILIVEADGRVSRPWPLDHALHANATVSLCSHHAVRQFRVRVVPIRAGAPALILLSTDGYANCFEENEDFHRVGVDFLSYLRAYGPEFVREKLGTWLQDSSRDGSGDDITVGLAVRLNALRASLPVAETEEAVSS